MTQPASAERQRTVPGLNLDIDDVIDTPAQVAAIADAASDREMAAIIHCTEALAAYVAELHAPHGFDQFLTPAECAEVTQFIAGLGKNAARADEFFEPRTGLELRRRNPAAGWNATTAREAGVRGTELQTHDGLPAYALECIALLQALIAYLDDFHGTDGFQEVLTPQERSKVGELISQILSD
ncbi:hypothetical protein OG394_29445 [Kribbella sp. NBC_01245]|uniref:hypothetical protein n=1 Tax=Kribbella sp. NBC_01245 TaxID=2903578 RepID=UPI002E2BB38E|nr:hypothetical protein [Kribbella sp. NBC_01245]